MISKIVKHIRTHESEFDEKPKTLWLTQEEKVKLDVELQHSFDYLDYVDDPRYYTKFKGIPIQVMQPEPTTPRYIQDHYIENDQKLYVRINGEYKNINDVCLIDLTHEDKVGVEEFLKRHDAMHLCPWPCNVKAKSDGITDVTQALSGGGGLNIPLRKEDVNIYHGFETDPEPDHPYQAGLLTVRHFDQRLGLAGDL